MGRRSRVEFQRQYRRAQRARNERITDWALASLNALEGTRARDRLFRVARTWADLRMIDPAIEPVGPRPNWCYLSLSFVFFYFFLSSFVCCAFVIYCC